MANQTVKYTAILPQDCMSELRIMAEKKVIPSVNQGIRAAVMDFVKTHKKREYRLSMREAAKDEAFVKRMTDTMKAFELADAEIGSEW